MATEQKRESSVRLLARGPARLSDAESFRISLDLLPDAAMIYAIDGTILKANAATAKIFEGNEDDFVGKSIYSMSVTDEERTREVVACLVRGKAIRFEIDFLTLKGHQLRLEILNIPLLAPTGEVERVLGFGRDITEQRRTEREQALLAAIVESSEDAIVSLSMDLTILTWNHGAEKLFGFTAAEAIGQPLTLNIPPERHAHALKIIDQLKAHPDQVIRFEGPNVRKDGKRLEVSTVWFAVRDRHGEIAAFSKIQRDITDSKRAENEQRTLAAIVNASGDAIINTLPDNRVLSWNAGAEKLFGIPAKEALGRSILEFVPREEHAQVGAAVADLSRTGKPTNLRLHSLRKDGTPFESWVNFFPTYDAHGNFSGVGAIGRDITEMVELQRQQARLAAIVESSDDAITIVSLDQRISYWNRGAERMFGFTAAEAMGQPFTLHIPHERHAHAREITEQLIAHPDRVVRFEGPNLRRDGARLEVSTVLFAIRDRKGKVLAISAVQRDLTERKRAEREAALLAAIVNSSHDAIINVSSESRIITWNPAAEKAYGYTAAEAIGQGVDLFVPPEDLPQSLAATRRIVETGQPVSLEQTAHRKDGTSFISAASLFPVRNAAGDVISVAGIGRDITRLKQIEKDLREARDYTRGLIESSVDAMVVVGRDLRISDGNEQLAKLTEVPKKILIGSRFDSYFTEPARAAAAIEKTLADGSVINYDLVLRDASGREILVSFNASVFSRAGAVSGIFGVARDVTEPRAIQRKLTEERQYSRSLVESSPDALLVTNSELVLTDVNRQTVHLTSYRREDLVGIRLASIFTEPERVSEVVRRALEAGYVREAEACLLTKAAEEIPVSLNASVFKNADGSTRGVLIGVRNISERKRAETERSLLASIVDASGDAIYSESTDLTITSWNAAAERLFGYNAGEMIGRNVAILVPLARRAEMLEHLSIISRSGKVERFETTRQGKDGSSVDVLLSRSPIFDSSRQRGRLFDHRARHQRSETRRGRIDRGARRRAGGRPGQVGFSRQHESRDPYPAQLGHRHDRSAARYPAQP